MQTRPVALRLGASALALLAAVPALAHAQAANAPAQLQEIVVTAQKREQRLQDVPVAVTALTGEALAANRITSVRDLDSVSPNLSVRTVAGGSLLPNYTIRGLVSQGSAVGSDKGVAVYIDGVYLGSGTGSIFELADIQRIEVLRGPQGTLFGRNSTGGAISFTTPDPTGEFRVRQTFTVGNLNQRRSVTQVDTPSLGAFSARLSYVHSERDGDVKNLGAGTTWNFCCRSGQTISLRSPKTLGASNVDSFATTVRFAPSDAFTALYRFDYTKTKYSQDAFGSLYAQPSIRTLRALQPNQALLTPISTRRPDAVNNADSVPSHNRAWGHSLTTLWRPAEGLTIKNIAAYRELKYDAYFADISGQGGLVNTGGALYVGLLTRELGAAGAAAAVAGNIGAPFLIQATATSGRDLQWSDEVQVNWDTRLVTLTAGLLWYKQDSVKGAGIKLDSGEERSGAFRLYPGNVVPSALQPSSAGGRDTKIKTKSKAVYAQAEVHVLPQVDVIGGVRYTEDRKTGTDLTLISRATPNFVFPVDYKDNQTNFNVGVNYKPNSDILLYGKYATGYISGGALSLVSYGPEKAKSLELGAKADWFRNTLRTNLALFDVKYSDLQLATNGANLTPARPEVSQALVNIGDAKAKGFELEVTYLPVRNLTLSTGIGYTDFKFTRLQPFITTGVSGVFAINRPKWTANVAAQYTSDPLFRDVTMVARIDGNWKSRQWGINTAPAISATFPQAERDAFVDAARYPSYWLVNGRVALQGFEMGTAKGSVALWGRNLFNSRAPSYSASLVTVIAAGFERARTYGVDVSLEF